MSGTAVLLLTICVLCYTGQTFFNKMFSVSYIGPEAAATPVFAAVYGLFVGLATLAYNGFVFAPSSVTLLFGVINGIVLFLYNLGAINAARTGPYAFQSLMTLFGAIACSLAFEIIVFAEVPSPVQIVGIVLMLASFVLFNLKGLHFEGMKKGYLLWVFVLFFTNGAYGILLDSQQRAMLNTQRNEMIITTFVVSAVISVVYLVLSQKKASLRCFNGGKKAWLYLILCSICAAVAVNLLMMTMKLVPAPILFTADNGGILVMSTLLSVTVLRERFTWNMAAGFGVAVVSMVLLAL